jgi:heat shock protein HslJ
METRPGLNAESGCAGNQTPGSIAVNRIHASLSLIPCLLLAACASAPPVVPELAGSAWTVSGYRSDGQLQPVLAGSRLSARFGEDGRVTGSAGCNLYFASYQSNAAELHIGPAGATRKACPEPAGLMQQETQFLEALSSSVKLMLRDGRLELLQTDGAVAVTLAPDPG